MSKKISKPPTEVKQLVSNKPEGGMPAAIAYTEQDIS
jgi:hypothetical protein